MEVEKTYPELMDFNVMASSYLKKNEGNENKLISAINKIGKQLKTIFEEYADLKDDLQLDCCSVDDKGIILKEADGSRKFTVPKEKELKKAIKELNKKKFKIHQRIPEGIEELISSLTAMEKEHFSEIIIPKQEE